MTSAMTAMAFRPTLQTLVYQRMYHMFRYHPQFATFRVRFPVAAPFLLTNWQTYLNQVNASATLLARAWLPTWVPTWLSQVPTQTAADTGSGSGGEEPPARDPKQLTVQRLVELLQESSSYVVHRTDDVSVGTCQVPLLAETDPHKMKNPMAPFGIYATIGITGLDYGPYGVVLRRDAVYWDKHEGAVVIYRGAQIDPSKMEGWYHVDDLQKAKKLKG